MTKSSIEKLNPFVAQDLFHQFEKVILQHGMNPYWKGKWTAVLTSTVLSLEWSGDIDLYGARDEQMPWSHWGGNFLLNLVGLKRDTGCEKVQEAMLSHTGDPYWHYSARWPVEAFQSKGDEPQDELVFNPNDSIAKQ